MTPQPLYGIIKKKERRKIMRNSFMDAMEKLGEKKEEYNDIINDFLKMAQMKNYIDIIL